MSNTEGELTTKHTLILKDLTNQELKNSLTILVTADCEQKDLLSHEKDTLKKLISIFGKACEKLPNN